MKHYRRFLVLFIVTMLIWMMNVVFHDSTESELLPINPEIYFQMYEVDYLTNTTIIRDVGDEFTNGISISETQPYHPLSDTLTQSPIQELSIIDDDTRYPVENSHMAPYSFVGMITVSWDENFDGKSDKYGMCTGFLFGPDVLMTSAHCVYDSENKAVATQIHFDPAKNSYYVPPTTMFRRSDAIALSIPLSYVLYQDIHHDFAIVVLDRTVGLDLGYFGFSLAEYLDNGDRIVVSGYPTGKPYGEMWTNIGQVKKLTDSILWHDCDTFRGQSGGPIYDQNHIVYGVHTRGTSWIQPNNSGTAISEWVFNVMMTYLDESQNREIQNEI